MRNCTISLALFTAFVLFMFAGSAQAAMLAYEGFDYTASSDLSTVGSGGSGWSGDWTDKGGNNNNSVEAGSLVPTGASAALSTTGNHTNAASVPGQGTRNGRFLDTSGGGVFDTAGYLDGSGNIGADGTTLYLSWLHQTNLATSNFHEFEFHRDDLGDGGRISGVGILDGGSTNFQLRDPDGESTVVAAANTDVNFFVVRIDFKAGADDVSVYMNPALGTEPVTPTLTAPGFGDMSFDGLSLGAFVNDPHSFNTDEIRVGQTYADVTPIPEPTSVVLLLTGLVGLAVFPRRRR